MASNLFWREFTRDGTPDRDHLADAQFLSTNFVDFFGKWLQDGQNSTTDTMDALTRVFFADGSFVTKANRPTSDWFNPHVRFLTIITLPNNGAFSTSDKEWTLCIVASSLLTNPQAFLQVASWNGKAFRFYQRDQNNQGQPIWNYFGVSTDAFGQNAYLGPFNGHVNGSCIMKELHSPWIHWFNPSSSDDFIACLSEKNKQDFLAAPYITQPGQGLLSALTTGPDVLEPMIEAGVTNWFVQRLRSDFFDAKSNLLLSPAHVPRWVAHLFLTTTINIFAATMDSNGTTFRIPADHFYDNELLASAGVGHLLVDLDVSISTEEYQAAVEKLRLSMLQEVDLFTGNPKPLDYLELPLNALGSDKRDEQGKKVIGFRVVDENSEGQAPFNILHSSFEDAQGVLRMQTLKKLGPNKSLGLFSQNTFNAIMMVDFWNPLYSWRRGILMQYVPQQTTWSGSAYDLEARFIQNVTESAYVKCGITDSPEYRFIELLKVNLSTHQKNINNYFGAIMTYLKRPDTRAQAIIDYLSLAESRRRIYRPLPLDEFGSSMPYALSIPYGSPVMEMRSDGRIQPMSTRGVDFLKQWTSSLKGVNPQVIPNAAEINGPVSISALPRPSLLALPCQSSLASTTTERVLAGRGCPY
ncbi:hypothetical protein B0H66DRAFT_485841, partial [Apodospora peruviana]